MKDSKKICLQLLLANRRKLNNLQYTVPSPDSYPYQWLWDSCFHAIILTHFNVTDAKKEILSLLSIGIMNPDESGEDNSPRFDIPLNLPPRHSFKENTQKRLNLVAQLFAKILTQKGAKKLVDKHLLNPKDFWRGPVWIATNWFIYKGLKNYGFDDIAKQIKESSIAVIEKSGFREYFDPITGEGLGAKDFTWGGLVLD